MTEEWKGLTPDQKKIHEATSNREKERYEREMKEYKKKLAAEGGAVDKQVGKKRPAAAPKAAKGKEEA